MKAYKGFLAILLTMVMILSMGAIGVGASEAEASDPTSPEVVFEQYIQEELLADMYATGKPWYELVDAKSQELGLSDENAFEIGINTGLYRYYTKDELPLPETKPAETTEATEITASTSAVTEPAETTEISTDSTEATDPTESTAPESESTDPIESASAEVTEATEQNEATEPSHTATAVNTESTGSTESTAPETIPTEPEKDENTNRYYFYMPEMWADSQYTLGAGIYWWAGTGAASSWPGYESIESDVENIYYYDVPKDVVSIIWNNLAVGGVDTPAENNENGLQTVGICSGYYLPGDSKTYPDGLESFDGMIFVVDLRESDKASLDKNAEYMGEWYYYYGNGEYGITPEKGDRVYTDSYLAEPIIPESPYQMGDVNLDGKLNIKDATAIQKFAAKMIDFDETQQALADINADTKINVKDATMIQKKIANLI